MADFYAAVKDVLRGLDLDVPIWSMPVEIEAPIPEAHALRRLSRIAELARATFLLEEASANPTNASDIALAEAHVERRVQREAAVEPSAAYLERLAVALG